MDYMELNPVFKYLKKDVMTRRSYQMNIDFFWRNSNNKSKRTDKIIFKF